MISPKRRRTALDGYLERLMRSRNPHERKSMLIGREFECGGPFLLNTDLLLEGMHIVGGPGSGKTTLGLMTDVIQLIRRNDGAVILVDCKGDMALMNTARIEAARCGRTFKWFTNRPNRSTYVFDPFDREVLRQMTVMEIVSFIIQSLNLHHGDDYGRAWFSILSQVQAKRAVQHDPRTARHFQNRAMATRLQPVESFVELHNLVQEVSQLYEDDFKSARHLSFVVENLAEFEQLNLMQRNHPAHANAIRMSEAVRNKEVIYFYLVGAADLVTVAEIGRLAIFALLNAVMAYKDATGRAPRVYCICDEAQCLIAQNIANVLAQARSHGLAMILAHQSMSQLNPPGGSDLRELVLSCMCIKQFFTARDLWLQDYVSQLSGQTTYYTASYENEPEDVLAGAVGPEVAVGTWTQPPRINIRESIGPRLMPHDIQAFSRDENTCLLNVERGRGYSHCHGFFPVYVDWPMDKDEYDWRQNQMGWPAGTDHTLEITPPWPAPTPDTIVATGHPGLDPGPNNPTVPQKLRKLRQELEKDED
jgi:hypothetical protein